MGLWAMARAHRVNTMSGHLGAAVVAGYFIGEQHPDLDIRVYRGIEGELDRIIRGESVFSPGQNAGIQVIEMFEPFPKEPVDDYLIDNIAGSLAANIGQTRESGHNVIFASIAIRALSDHPDLATPSIVNGIVKLISGFDDASPGSGNYGTDKGRINGRSIFLPQDDSFLPYQDLERMANTVVAELIGHAQQHREGFGGLWHLINHGAALIELERYGYRELALKGLPAHHQHVQLFRTLPDLSVDFGVPTPVDYDPRTPEFWVSDRLRHGDALLTHRIKTLYGFDTLIELVEDREKWRLADEKLRYLM